MSKTDRAVQEVPILSRTFLFYSLEAEFYHPESFFFCFRTLFLPCKGINFHFILVTEDCPYNFQVLIDLPLTGKFIQKWVRIQIFDINKFNVIIIKKVMG